MWFISMLSLNFFLLTPVIWGGRPRIVLCRLQLQQVYIYIYIYIGSIILMFHNVEEKEKKGAFLDVYVICMWRDIPFSTLGMKLK